MLMMKPKDEVIASKKKPEFIDQVKGNGNSMGDKKEGESEGSDAELAAQDFLDAVKSGDPKMVVDAFMALDAACDAISPEEQEEEAEEEGEDKPKGGIVSIILGKKKPG